MTIQAYAAFERGQPLRPLRYEPEPLKPYEVEIAVTHCGICHSDIHMIDNDWGISRYPLVPGHEIVGTVAAVGSSVRHLSRGQRVGVGWQSASCMTCEWCVRGDENSCPEQEAVIVGRHGGYASTVHVDGRFAFVIPEGLPSETVGPLLCGGVTVYTPLRADARPWSRVGVIGIGGLGHMALQFARAFGCEVTAFSTSANKSQEARDLGAHNFVLSTDEGAMKRAGGSLDVLVAAATAPLDWAAWLNVLRPHGTLAIVGASPGTVNVAPMEMIVGKKSIRGSAIGNRAAIQEMLGFAARHNIQARTEVLPMSEVNAALDKVRRNQARYRMVLRNTAK